MQRLSWNSSENVNTKVYCGIGLISRALNRCFQNGYRVIRDAGDGNVVVTIGNKTQQTLLFIVSNAVRRILKQYALILSTTLNQTSSCVYVTAGTFVRFKLQSNPSSVFLNKRPTDLFCVPT